ncbi:lysophosphatidylserine lipase ABHD12 isoform X1 [Aricia agestis]|uniref:lysophosphatidylserine lipase ABHD12 isoform X1 n=1 Tax=Aricia agestis TaxID=91739 RepID=UPI001C203BB6|nr:lysophosphatidylserine lipase ABHD12 isoform X1 [Aricia agestis]
MHVLSYVIVPFYIILYLLLGASITATIFFIHVIIVPLVFKYSKTFQRGIIFSNFLPVFRDLEDPASSGLDGARNLYIEFQSKVDNCRIKIGLWHILPKSVNERLKTKLQQTADKEELNSIFDEALATSKTPIILYAHGNALARTAPHRVLLYQLFQKLDYHTIALDYRGYGDSTNVNPSEDGVVEDLLMVYDWIRTIIDKSDSPPPVFVWGHSLGTGISSHLLGNLDTLCSSLLDRPLPQPQGLILEAPFTTLEEEVANYCVTPLVTWLPYFNYFFLTPFVTRRHAFNTVANLARSTVPILILHARDDIIVPYALGEKLYKSVKQSRGGAVLMHSFDRRENLGHKMICAAEGLDKIVGDFITDHQ